MSSSDCASTGRASCVVRTRTWLSTSTQWCRGSRRICSIAQTPACDQAHLSCNHRGRGGLGHCRSVSQLARRLRQALVSRVRDPVSTSSRQAALDSITRFSRREHDPRSAPVGRRRTCCSFGRRVAAHGTSCASIRKPNSIASGRRSCNSTLLNRVSNTATTRARLDTRPDGGRWRFFQSLRAALAARLSRHGRCDPVQQSTRRSGRSLKTEPKQEANAEPKAESKPQANNRKRSIESSPEDSNPSKRPKPLEPPPPTVASTATTTAAGTTTDSQAPPSRTRSKGASAASKAETTRSAPPVTKAPAQAMPTAVADDPSTLEMEDAMAVAAAPETRAASRVHKCFIVGGSAEDKQRSLNIIHELGCTYAGLTNESTREVTLIRRALCCYVACVDTYSDEYTAESTHLVLSEIKRTEKLLCTSAAGKWVIKPPYLYVRTATRSLSSQVSRKRTLDIAISYVERHAFMPTTHRSSSLSGIKMRWPRMDACGLALCATGVNCASERDMAASAANMVLVPRTKRENRLWPWISYWPIAIGTVQCCLLDRWRPIVRCCSACSKLEMPPWCAATAARRSSSTSRHWRIRLHQIRVWHWYAGEQAGERAEEKRLTPIGTRSTGR